jgi:uncharacterized membrane protein
MAESLRLAIAQAPAVLLWNPPRGGLRCTRPGPLSTPWLALSILLYGLIGCCWLQVVWLQVRMRNLSLTSAAMGLALPAAYQRYFRWWLLLGWPAFPGVMAIFYLMVAKPRL